MEGIYRRDYSIRYDEVDLHNRLTPLAIFNCCQDAASRHTRRLGLSLADLRRQGITWVISRFRLVIERYPRPGTIVTVTTWPSSREGYFSCREFTLTDPEGSVWGRGTSSWAAIDLESRRPVRLDDRRLPVYPLLPERAVDDPFATLPRVERADAEVTVPVMRRDLDQNLHVNSSVYLEWGLEVIPDRLYTSSLPVDLAINFRSEAFAGETITSRMQLQEGEPPTCVHQIVAADGRELARLVTVWGRQESPLAGSAPCPSSAI
jgi:acyl-ACP thioesterase